jgi:hypothetical protein
VIASRDAIYAALAARLAAALPTFKAGRQYLDFDDPRVVHPACIVVASRQQALQESGRPTRWNLEAKALLYLRQKDDAVVTDTVINQTLDAVVSALAVQPTEYDGAGGPHTTLGGLVLHAWVDGAIDIFQGLPGDQTVVVVPITMLAA